MNCAESVILREMEKTHLLLETVAALALRPSGASGTFGFEIGLKTRQRFYVKQILAILESKKKTKTSLIYYSKQDHLTPMFKHLRMKRRLSVMPRLSNVVFKITV